MEENGDLPGLALSRGGDLNMGVEVNTVLGALPLEAKSALGVQETCQPENLALRHHGLSVTEE